METSTCEHGFSCFYNVIEEHVMNIPTHTFKNVNLKFDGEEGKQRSRKEERERQHTIFEAVTLSRSFSSPEITEC